MFSLDEFLDQFERIRRRTHRVAECIPEDRLEWTYKAGAFTLGDLVRHIAVTERFLWAETVHDRPVRYTSHGRELADGREAVLALLDRLHAESIERFRALTPAALAGTCQTPAGTRLVTSHWLRLMLEHEIHHRGQIYTMLGMLDVPTPPLYGLTSAEVRGRATRGGV
jgi:uncharacterized damage-inducible protein DinB